MNSVMSWVSQNKAVYFGNATATRDFRVQLRGSKSALLFGVYLTILIGTAMVVYSQAVSDQRMSVVEAQRHLETFYLTIMELLAGAICLIAPALSATTVVMERQRQSLDLVFSAPVTPKYYLVGKMLSSYRYIWMLLTLSLPVTASCVVLGGASWTDVLGAYVLLSIHALVLCSLSLLMSTVAPKPVSAILWSYAICIPYLLAMASGAGSAVSMGAIFHTHTLEMPFLVAMSPFTVTFAAGTYTVIAGLQVPNWIVAVGVSLLITKIAVLCAGAVLAPASGKEPTSLRLHGMVYLLAAMGIGGYQVGAVATVAATAGSSGYSATLPTYSGQVLGVAFNWLLMPLICVIPFMACFGYDGLKRFKPDGMFNFKGMFRPTPAGALPYVLTLIVGAAASLAIGVCVASQIHGTTVNFPAAERFSLYVMFAVAFWSFFWAVGRFTSTLGMGLRASRALMFAAFVAICALPVPVLSMLGTTDRSFYSDRFSVWSLWVLRPLFPTNGVNDQLPELVIYAGLLGLMALAFAFEAERRVRANLAAKKSTSERTARAA